MEKEIKKCDYCSKETNELRGTPYIADIPALMCRNCWEITPVEHSFDEDED
jgi:hypothetical protein